MGSRKTALCALVTLCLLTLCHGDKIPGVCTDVTNPPADQPTKPDIPNQFRVKVECNMLESNMTTVVTEWYDYTNNKARIEQLDLTDWGDFYFDYHNNELLRVDRMTDGSCEMLRLSGNTNNFLFGITTTSDGQEHVLTPASALHFGNSPELYQGDKFTVRGILAQAWTSCQYSQDLDATMNVTWYFSAVNEWDMQLGAGSLPLRAVVTGKRNDAGGGNHNFSHIYELFDFQLTIRPDDFQLNAGDYCPGRVNTKPFPQLAKTFSIVGEMTNFDTEQFMTIEEHYDDIRKLNVYNYKDMDGLGYLTGANDRTEINDFEEGYAYMINNARKSCQIRLVSEGEFAYVDTSGSTVRQQKPSEFFLTTNITWVYGGVKTERGIQCDTWVGRTNKSRAFPGNIVTIEWAFATTNYQDPNALVGLYQIPVKMRTWKHGADGDADTSYEYNAFGFSQNSPRIANIDISPCFHGSDRANVRFRINGSYISAVRKNVQNFKVALMDSISLFIGISRLRVADIKLYPSTDLLISFDLVDKPSFSGDISNPAAQTSLSDALSFWASPSTQHVFQISVPTGVGDNIANIKMIPNSWRVLYNGTCNGDCSSPTGPGTGTTIVQTTASSGFSGGALAGLGVAMLLVGGGLGSGGGFFVFRSTPTAK